MSVQLKNPMIEEKSLEDIKLELRALKGYDLIVLEKRVHCNLEIYTNPKRRTIIGHTEHFIITENNNGIKETFMFTDFFSKQLIYEIIEVVKR